MLFSCKEDVLEKTIFIPDKTYPELPAYTEWGYNSFGAFYEKDVIIATNDYTPCNIVYHHDGTLDFSLTGRYLGYQATLTFSFPLSEVTTINDLKVLHQKVIPAKDCIVKFKETTLEISGGELNFKRFQLLQVDEAVNRIILSGTFDLKFQKNGREETISLGRFDMGITDRDFYSNVK
jgi:hypothetical protein